MKAKVFWTGAVLTLIWLVTQSPASAQTNPIFLQLGQAKGALYKPDSGPAPHVGIVVMHREANYMNNIACTEFSKRGFMVLCMNSRFENNESIVNWELIPLDVAQGVNYLRNTQHMTKMILYGNSGGGVTMSFYQAVAENGPGICQLPNKLVKCGNNLANLTPANGIILSDGHPGNPILRLRSVNPSIVRNNNLDGVRIQSKLDPFDPANGYNPNGVSIYSKKFKQQYFTEQADTMNDLIEQAQRKLAEINEGLTFYTDDAPFDIAGFDNARLLSLDSSIRHTTIQPEKFLKNDGSIVVQIVPSIAPPRPELAQANKTFADGARNGLTVKSFLSSNAIRATDSMDENQIDLCSSNNSTPCMLQSVSVPLLAAANQASFQNLIQEIEINYLYAKSPDKDFIVVEGATTGVTPCTNCGVPSSNFSNVTKNFFDYAANWINSRF
jgi:hypothetical protein